MKEVATWLFKNAFQVGGLIFLFVGLYFAKELSPIIYRLNSLEEYKRETEPLIPQFYVVQANEKNTNEKLNEINDNIKKVQDEVGELKGLNQKVDVIIELVKDE